MSGFPRPITAAQVAAAGALLKANNLNDVANAGTSRTSLGLGTAAVQNVGAFAQVANNLSDVTAATARANLAVVPLNVTVNAQTDDYTLVLADLGKLVTMTKATALTLTVPTNASVAFAVGAEILVAARGAGQLTVAGAGGVTVNGAPGLKLTDQYAYAALVQVAANTWDLTGRLSA